MAVEFFSLNNGSWHDTNTWSMDPEGTVLATQTPTTNQYVWLTPRTTQITQVPSDCDVNIGTYSRPTSGHNTLILDSNSGIVANGNWDLDGSDITVKNLNGTYANFNTVAGKYYSWYGGVTCTLEVGRAFMSLGNFQARDTAELLCDSAVFGSSGKPANLTVVIREPEPTPHPQEDVSVGTPVTTFYRSIDELFNGDYHWRKYRHIVLFFIDPIALDNMSVKSWYIDYCDKQGNIKQEWKFAEIDDISVNPFDNVTVLSRNTNINRNHISYNFAEFSQDNVIDGKYGTGYIEIESYSYKYRSIRYKKIPVGDMNSDSIKCWAYVRQHNYNDPHMDAVVADTSAWGPMGLANGTREKLEAWINKYNHRSLLYTGYYQTLFSV